MSWGISEHASEINKLKADINDFLKGMNSCGEIDYNSYSQIFDLMEVAINKAYNLGSNLNKHQNEIIEKAHSVLHFYATHKNYYVTSNISSNDEKFKDFAKYELNEVTAPMAVYIEYGTKAKEAIKEINDLLKSVD